MMVFFWYITKLLMLSEIENIIEKNFAKFNKLLSNSLYIQLTFMLTKIWLKFWIIISIYKTSTWLRKKSNKFQL